MMAHTLMEALKRGADECASEGVAGWGNTMTAAVEAIEQLEAQRDELLAALEGLMVAIGEGTAKGRAIDLIDRRYTDRASAAIRRARPCS